MENIIGLREFREKTQAAITKIKKGESLVVLKRSKPLFRVVPLDYDEQWEKVVDFTTAKKGGVDIKDVLERL